MDYALPRGQTVGMLRSALPLLCPSDLDDRAEVGAALRAELPEQVAFDIWSWWLHTEHSFHGLADLGLTAECIREINEEVRLSRCAADLAELREITPNNCGIVGILMLAQDRGWTGYGGRDAELIVGAMCAEWAAR